MLRKWNIFSCLTRIYCFLKLVTLYSESDSHLVNMSHLLGWLLPGVLQYIRLLKCKFETNLGISKLKSMAVHCQCTAWFTLKVTAEDVVPLYSNWRQIVAEESETTVSLRWHKRFVGIRDPRRQSRVARTMENAHTSTHSPITVSMIFPFLAASLAASSFKPFLIVSFSFLAIHWNSGGIEMWMSVRSCEIRRV